MEITNETLENAEVVVVAYEQPTVKEQVVGTLIGLGVTATVYVAAVGAVALINVAATRISTYRENKKLWKEAQKSAATSE